MIETKYIYIYTHYFTTSQFIDKIKIIKYNNRETKRVKISSNDI